MKRISSARRRAYRSRHRQSIGWNGRFLIVFAVCAFALFILAILLGNYLGKTAGGVIPSSGDGSDTAHTAPVPPSGPRPAPQTLLAGYVPLSGSGSTDTSGETVPDAPSAVAYDAASVVLRAPLPKKESEVTDTGDISGIRTGTGMRLFYTSAVSSVHGYDESDPTDLVSALAGIRSTPGREKICGIFYVLYPTSSYSIKNVMKEYEKALIAELVSAGVDDILLVGFDGSTLSEAGSFVSELVSATGGVCSFGIAFDFDFYSGAGTELKQLIKTMSSGGMYFALDLSSSEVPGLMTPESLIFDRVDRLSSFLLTYGIRVVVGCGPEEGYGAEASAAVRAGAVSVQVRGRPE
ncbi:MAG: hypothetical protein MJ137_01045 [Clostridia bacterium]|nr:hypothetical protein [Clostridia bacterium]